MADIMRPATLIPSSPASAAPAAPRWADSAAPKDATMTLMQRARENARKQPAEDKGPAAAKTPAVAKLAAASKTTASSAARAPKPKQQQKLSQSSGFGRASGSSALNTIRVGPASHTSSLAIRFTPGQSSASFATASSFSSAPPTKKQRKNDGSARPQDAVDRTPTKATVVLQPLTPTAASASSKKPQPFPLSAAFMVPTAPESISDDEDEAMSSPSSPAPPISRAPLRVPHTITSRNPSAIKIVRASFSSTAPPVARSPAISIPIAPLAAIDLGRSHQLSSSPLPDPSSSVRGGSSPAPSGTGLAADLKLCSSCKKTMPLSDTRRTCLACRAVGRQQWHARKDRKASAPAPAPAPAVPSPARTPSPPADTAATKKCSQCAAVFPAHVPFKQCDACRARGREHARRFAERKRLARLPAAQRKEEEEEDVEEAPAVAGGEFQTERALHRALRCARRARGRFEGACAAVADPTVIAPARLELAARALRKLGKLPLGARESTWATAKNASARYTCTCAGAGVACGGTIDLAVEVDDKAHAFLVAERLTVKITH